ncbi:MAG: acyl-CoA thioesterase [Nocardioidaceae bacterium]|nr:acyl-CoA thioesterase [Nocardioidaceae bacterium]NUS49445.1 acyl-CoA thioesterase [Nocardioidaceae bacterium]
MTDLSPLPLRFRDVDSFGHVYHAEYLTLLDELRSQFFREVLHLDRPEQFVVVRLEIDYVDSLVLADRTVTARIALEKVGRTSLTLAESMRAADGREVARTRTVVVLWDAAGQAKRALTDTERERAEARLGT